MISTLLSLLIGWLGLGLVISIGCLLAWYFIPEVPWLTSKTRKLLLVIGIAVGLFNGGFIIGSAKAISTYKAKLEREKARAIKNGDTGRANALRDFDAAPDDELPDDGFRRP